MNADAIAQLLPRVIAATAGDGSPLDGVLAAMETLHAPVEAVLARRDRLFDPRRTDPAFVEFLARWVHFDVLIDPGRPGQRIGRPGPVVADTGALRELVAAAAELAAWRGTRRGLLRFLRAATGVDGFTIDEAVPGDDGAIRTFHMRVGIPPAAAAKLDLVHQVVRMAKPAHVTYDLAVG